MSTQHKPYNEPKAGFLGLGHSSFRPSGPGKDDLVLKDITTDRLGDRKTLLASVDRFRRNWDNSGQMEGMDSFSQRAMGILTSSDLFKALDILILADRILGLWMFGILANHMKSVQRAG